MKTKYKVLAAAVACVAGLASAEASAQLFCRTPVGDFPMMVPPGVPLIQGVFCNGHSGPGYTVIMGGGAPMPNGPFPGAPFPGAPFPGNGGPLMQPPMGPQGMAAGQLAGAFGVNREGQVAAQCVGQFGVTWAGAGCVASRLTVDELNKCFNDGIGGRGCFGDNNTLVQMIRSNLDAAQRERGALNQGIRATTGISIRDIEQRGILGGDNSEARKACDGVARIFGGRF